MSSSPHTHRIIALVAWMCLTAPAHAENDVITVSGVAVTGTIVSIEAAGIVIEPAFGKGSVTISYDTIESIESERNFSVLYGDSEEVLGKIVGFESGHLLIGAGHDTAVTVAPESIFAGSPFNGSRTNWDRLRSRWRYWSASADAGLSYFDATTDTLQASVGVGAERRRAGTRLLMQSGYRFSTEKQQGEGANTLTNELRGLVKGEYDITPRFLLLASLDGEYDEIERLSFRGVPKLGLGYRILKTSSAFLQLESAPSYVYERFFGGDTNDFFGISFGAELGATLPLGSELTWRLDYLPAIDNWTEDYLIRSQAALTMPLVSVFHLRFAVANQYDNTPASGIDRNEIQTTLGIAVRL